MAVVAIDTLTYVALYLQEEMDSQAVTMCRALLLKIAQANGCASLQKRASTALGVVVQCCSPGILINVLVNTGLRYVCRDNHINNTNRFSRRNIPNGI